jgi:1,4-dihydroxy-2-naphthoate octaprenyltransferase
LILIGIVLWAALGWTLIGLLCIIVGIVLLFVPHTYGYADYRGRRRGPPAV